MISKYYHLRRKASFFLPVCWYVSIITESWNGRFFCFYSTYHLERFITVMCTQLSTVVESGYLARWLGKDSQPIVSILCFLLVSTLQKTLSAAEWSKRAILWYLCEHQLKSSNVPKIPEKQTMTQHETVLAFSKLYVAWHRKELRPQGHNVSEERRKQGFMLVIVLPCMAPYSQESQWLETPLNLTFILMWKG